jgi:hypothetical protein
MILYVNECAAFMCLFLDHRSHSHHLYDLKVARFIKKKKIFCRFATLRHGDTSVLDGLSR